MCLATSWAFASDIVIEEIIARIGDQIITRSDWQRTREQLLNQMRDEGVSSSDARTAAVDKDLLRDLIDQRLLVEKGKELGITADTDLVKRLDELRKQMNLSSIEALEEEAKKQGISYEEFKQNLRNNIITQQVIQREVGGRLNISPEEEKQFYEAHKEEMARPEQVHLSEILVSPQQPEGQKDPTQAAADPNVAAEQKAKQALAEIQSGKSFSEVARKYSNGPSAAQGGDLGFFKRGTLAKELEDKTFGMKTGEVTDVIRTQQGFVILKVENHQEAGVPPFNAVQQQIGEQLYYQKLQPALRTYLTKLREDAFIEVKPGYVDSGASTNQANPVIAPPSDKPAAPVGKEKKKKKRGWVKHQ
jgi:peptidyl-prolyl cis-trans isomerase SurA